jgi:hypothetical protein
VLVGEVRTLVQHLFLPNLASGLSSKVMLPWRKHCRTSPLSLKDYDQDVINLWFLLVFATNITQPRGVKVNESNSLHTAILNAVD